MEDSQPTGFAGLLSDEVRRQDHLRGQGQEPEEPGVPVLPRLPQPHPQGARHGGEGGRLRHHAGGRRDGGLRAGVQPHQDAPPPLQHPAQGRQALPLHPHRPSRGLPQAGAGAQAGQGRREVLRPLPGRNGGARGAGRGAHGVPHPQLHHRHQPGQAPKALHVPPDQPVPGSLRGVGQQGGLRCAA